MSLNRSHFLWTTAGSSPSKICKATIQASFLSGRYHTEALTRHWSTNKSGSCLLSSVCQAQNLSEDVRHILQFCPALQGVREKLFDYTRTFTSNFDTFLKEKILALCLPSNPDFCQFIVDCSTLPSVISLVQSYGSSFLSVMFEISRTWVFVIHRERLRRLDRWKPGQQL